MASSRKPSPRSTTHATSDGHAAPRLPHERDESSDSGTSEPRAVMRQAHDDIESGKQATDRGEATDAAYQRQKTPAAASPAKRVAAKPAGKR